MNKRKKSKTYPEGSKWLQSNGCYLEVVEFLGNSSFMVKFEDSPVFKADAKEFRKGAVKNKNKPQVYNVGYIGYGEFMSKNTSKKHTPEYEVWRGVIRRCYDENARQYNIYGGRGVTVCEEWHNFQNFAQWYTSLPDYNKGFHLDKDLLDKSNTVYSPEKCTLVPPSVNSLFTGGFKSIVHMNARNNKWVVQMQMGEKCLNGNKRQSYFGEYHDRDEAIEVYFENKIKHVISVANKEKENLDERVYLNLINPTWIREYIEELTLSHKDNGEEE